MKKNKIDTITGLYVAMPVQSDNTSFPYDLKELRKYLLKKKKELQDMTPREMEKFRLRA